MVPEVRGGDVGVYIPSIFRKYYYKLTVFSTAYRHVTMGMDRGPPLCEASSPKIFAQIN